MKLAYEVALRRGVSVNDLDPVEMDEWESLSKVTPLTLGDVCRVIAHGFAAMSNGVPIDPLDLLPWEKKTPVEQTPEEMLAAARGIAAAQNGV